MIASHVIPRYYLHQFAADDDGHLWVYAKGRKPRIGRTYSESVEKGYFAKKTAEGPFDESLEGILAAIEHKVTEFWPFLTFQTLDLSPRWRSELAEYIAVLHVRATARRDYNCRMWVKQIEEMRQVLSDDEFVERLAARYSLLAKRFLTPQFVRESILRVAEQQGTENAMKGDYIQNLPLNAGTIAELLLLKAWEVWLAPEGSEFITTDNPVVTKMPKFGPDAIGWGFRREGVLVVCPIGTRACIAMGDLRRQSPRVIPSQWVEEINRNEIACMTRFAYSSKYVKDVETAVNDYGGWVCYGDNAFAASGPLPSVRDAMEGKLPAVDKGTSRIWIPQHHTTNQ